MKTRKITSLTALIAFCLMILTSIILYIVPQGRVAYWADWRLWGLSKTQWGNLHINFGFLFLLAIVWHIYLNWKPMVSYFKNKARDIQVLNRNVVIALVIVVVVGIGTFLMIPPFSTILNLSERIKDTAALKYGEPPFGHAELAPLKSLVQKTGLALDFVLDIFKKAGIDVEGPDQIFLDIAQKNSKTPQELFGLIQPDEKSGLPDLPPPGTGNKTISMICKEYRLDEAAVLHGFKQSGMSITADQTMKAIGTQNDLSPIQVYDMIKDASK